MIVEIKAALKQMHEDRASSEALFDCISAINFSKEALEQHLTKWLWLPEGEDYATEEDKAYAITLGRVEERLVEQGLIYN